jgi:hypothetical protein
MKIQLIKDLKNYRAVFYWANVNGKKLSPILPTLIHAYEWHLQFHKWLYKGEERRNSKVDRRLGILLDLKKRKKDERRSSNKGRRCTDTSLHISKDLFAEKVALLKQETFISTDSCIEEKVPA